MSGQNDRPVLSRGLTALMALACGIGVANAYFPQAITPLLRTGLHVSTGAAATVATAAQLGYAGGIFLLVPLGDRLSRRPLIAVMFGLVAAGLLLAATATAITPLYLFSMLVGIVTVVPQVLIPMAADLADGRNAGRTLGMLQGGLLAGILLARAFGGALGQALGWRAPYLVAGVLAALLAIALAIALPSTKSATTDRYPTLLATSLRLFTGQPELRRSCLYQAALFGAFTAAWTSITFLLTGPGYRYGTGVVGIVALVGAASVLVVPLAGRLTDRRGPDIVNLVCFFGVALAGAVLLIGARPGRLGLAGLIAGLLMLDVSVQSSQVANQARIFALVPGARSRLNSVYMTCVFLGGSAGSWIGARVYLALGWVGVCALLGVAAIVALARHAAHRMGGRTRVLAESVR